MNDAEFEEQKGRIARLREKWVKPLGLGWWRIDTVYCRERIDSDRPLREDGAFPIMRCDALWEYLKATITIDMPAIAEQDDERLEEYFVHELCHIFVNEMREVSPGHDGWIKHEERVVTHLTSAFLWLRKHAEEPVALPVPTEHGV